MNPDPLQLWQEKLRAFQCKEAITSDEAEKFQLKKQIEECKQKIAESSESIENPPRRRAGKGSDRENFAPIRDRLGLELENTVAFDSFPARTDEPSDDSGLDELVREIRVKVHDNIRERCGLMRVLDMTHPIDLDTIYTDVNILREMTARRRLELGELLENCQSEEFDRLGFTDVSLERLSGLEAVREFKKLMLFGKPGAGKTTFLKRLAILCNAGRFQEHRVPIFISLRDFGDSSDKPELFPYIRGWLEELGIQEASDAKQILSEGRGLLLLDGLDEVSERTSKLVLREILKFSESFPHNAFVLSCRIAAREFTFPQFVEVEVADFTNKQIADFAERWFGAKQLTEKAGKFLEKLNGNPRVKELATNPLLLTLLCLDFEGRTDFPANRSELYRESLDTLLKKWDGTRGIEREEVYRELSLKRKEDLLSQLAYTTFKSGNYYFKRAEAERAIEEYIQNLPGVGTDSEALHLDSEAVLKSIEAQHGLLVERAKGIYSFFHLTFHEYFTARYIVGRANPENFEDPALAGLTYYVLFKKWREVFLLTAELLPNADILLLRMKFCIDLFASQSRVLQQLLAWAYQKSQENFNSTYSQQAIRAFYISLAVGSYVLDHSEPPWFPDWNILEVGDLLETIEPKLQLDFDAYCGNGFCLGFYNGSIEEDSDLALDFHLVHTRCHLSLLGRAALGAREANIETINYSFNDLEEDEWELFWEKDHPLDDSNFYTIKHSLYSAIEISERSRQIELANNLNILKNSLPRGVYDNCWNEYYFWYKNRSADCGERLKELNQRYRNIDYNLDLEKDCHYLLSYCYANKLLLDCLDRSYVSKEVKQHINDTLLMPVNEIQKNYPIA